MDTEFILLRHGQTVANRQGLLQGWYESPLDENGRKQAACAAEYLTGLKIDMAYSSDLSRAAETARIALTHHPEVPLELVPELREWHCGVFEGRRQAEMVAEHPEVVQAFIRENGDTRMEGGETRSEFQSRVTAFMTSLVQRHAGKTILICTHGGTMQRIFTMAVGTTAAANRIPLPANASVSRIRYISSMDGWMLEEWNIHHYLAHLELTNTLVV